MSDVKQTIQVTNAGLSPILSIAQGTGMVDFEFTVSDFQIPIGSTAVAHNIQPTGNIVSQVCTLVGNVITVTPPAYYFLRGKNYMQIQLIGADGVNLFTFLIEVWCSPNISAPVVSQNPDLISQLMAMIGNTQDLDTTAKNNLVAAINEIYARGVVDILDTEEEIEANTDAGKATGALVTKQLISELTANETKFYFDFQNEQWGFNTDPARGADTFHPFRSAPIDCGTYAATMNYAGSSLNVDIKQYCTDYKKLTKDNFFIIVNTINFSSTTAANVAGTITYSYDADAGIFTVYGKVPNNFWSAAINFNLYALL